MKLTTVRIGSVNRREQVRSMQACAIAILSLLWCICAYALEPTERTIDVTKGKPGNPVGVGYNHRLETVPLKVHFMIGTRTPTGAELTVNPYVDEGNIWEMDGDGPSFRTKTPAIKPDAPFAIKFKGKYTIPAGLGGSGRNLWDSGITDIDLDADTDNYTDPEADHRPPDESDEEDLWEYTGDGIVDEVVGLLIPLDDNHDVSLATQGDWKRDFNNTWALANNPDPLELALKAHVRTTSKFYFDMQQSPPKITVHDEDGDAAPSNYPAGLKESIVVPANMTSTDQVELDRTYYIQGIKTTASTTSLLAYMMPDNRNALLEYPYDSIKYLVVRTDIDVDGDNNADVSAANEDSSGEDFNEDKPGLPGMCLTIDETDTDSDDILDNGWDGSGWEGSPEAETVEDYSVMYPAVLDNLILTSEQAETIDGQAGTIMIYKKSGAGAVRVFTKEDTPANARFIGTFMDDGDWEKDAGGDDLYEIVSEYSATSPHWPSLNLRIEGLKPGHVELAVQLLANGCVIHEDVVRLTVTGLELSVNDDDDVEDAVDGINSYLPGYEGTTAKITSNANGVYTGPQAMKLVALCSPTVYTVDFSITASSCLVGFCENSTTSPTATDDDYSFANNSNEREASSVSVASGKAVQAFYCKDYGGYCTVRAQIKDSEGNTLATITRKIPADLDDDHIADFWERTMVEAWNVQYGSTEDVAVTFFAAADDKEARDPDGGGSLGTHADTGDNFTALEEYRGYLGTYSDDWNRHRRLSPARKEMFVEVDVMASHASPPHAYTAISSAEADTIMGNVASTFLTTAGVQIYYHKDDLSVAWDQLQIIGGDWVGVRAWLSGWRDIADTGEKDCRKFVHCCFVDDMADVAPGIGWSNDDLDGAIVVAYPIEQWAAGQTPAVDRLGAISWVTAHELGHSARCADHSANDDFVMYHMITADGVSKRTFSQTIPEEVPSMNVKNNYGK